MERNRGVGEGKGGAHRIIATHVVLARFLLFLDDTLGRQVRHFNFLRVDFRGLVYFGEGPLPNEK